MSAPPDEHKELLTTHRIYSLIDDVDFMNVLAIALTGGESLLRKDFFDIAQYISDKGMQIYLTTNGTTLVETTIKELKKIGIKQITISVEGITESSHDAMRGKGSFKKTMKGLHLLLKHRMNVEVAITLCRHNIEEIPRIIQFCKENGVSGVQINRLVNVGRGSQLRDYTGKDCEKIGLMLSEISKEYGDYVNPNPSLMLCRIKREKCNNDIAKDTACGAGFTFCCVLWNGDVVPCLLTRDMIFGNIRDQPLSEIWGSSPSLKAFRSAFEDPQNDALTPCNSCRYKDFCGKGCRAQAYHTYGSFTYPDPICRRWEEIE
jgi:radical SAM protein with 4Fe4S-binding SPASM domain